MAYINTETLDYPLTVDQIKALSPDTSFPVNYVPSSPYEPVLNSPTPVVPNPVIQYAKEITPAQDSLGNWMQQWEIVDRYQTYTDPDGVVHTKQEQEAAAIEADDESKKSNNKRQAEQLLVETDWTMISDVSDPELSDPYLVNAAEFVVYRNAIRKIAVNPPVVAVWPVKPENVWSE